jgi:predicted molibdopterin-dependent oxidoreductase YjgC
MVEVDKRLKPACCTPAYDGAVINTDTDEASKLTLRLDVLPGLSSGAGS